MNIDKSQLNKEITDKYSIVSNTFIGVAKDNPKDLVEIQIGDSKQTDFYPQIKIMRWNNEVNLSYRLKHDENNPVITTEADKIKWQGDKIECHFYDINNEEHPEGASEFEVILKEKPKTNVVEFSLNTKGLDFALQPRIDAGQVAEEKARADGYENISWFNREFVDLYYNANDRKDGYTETDGPNSHRPENVVGSYVVYASENKINYVGGKEYKTGQVGIIYRPRIEDSIGNWVWGELNIDTDKGILSVTIPQEFLDDAVYPVKHASGLTFGYDTIGSSTEYQLTSDLYGSLFTSPSNISQVDSITYYSQYAGSAWHRGVIVLHSNLNIVSNGVSPEAYTNMTTADWRTRAYSSKPTLSTSTEYVLCVISIGMYGYYNSGDANQGHYDGSNNEGTPSNPTDATHTTNKYSIYATYTASASGPANLKSLNTNLKANIKSINGNLIANVKSLNTIT
jgi:hypothetical protein